MNQSMNHSTLESSSLLLSWMLMVVLVLPLRFLFLVPPVRGRGAGAGAGGGVTPTSVVIPRKKVVTSPAISSNRSCRTCRSTAIWILITSMNSSLLASLLACSLDLRDTRDDATGTGTGTGEGPRATGSFGGA